MAKLNIDELFESYRSNIFPRMLRKASLDFNLSEKSINELGIGFNPDHQSWVFPERDETGGVIGLTEVYPNGDKGMISGSKRGLTYVFNKDYQRGKKYVSGRHNWMQVTPDLPCPVCGKQHWCMISTDDPYNPGAVLCHHVSEGCTKKLSDNMFLHTFGDNSPRGKGSGTPLMESEDPIIVVEGKTDVLAAMDIGLVAVGRPSAKGKIQLLKKLCRGQNIIVVGENDDNNVGQQGMELVFNNLASVCNSIAKVLPPKTVNDLREWITSCNLAKKEFLDWVDEHGEKGEQLTVFPDDIAYNIAMYWIKQFKTVNDFVILRNYKGQWAEFQEGRYNDVDYSVLRGDVYGFLDGKQVTRLTSKGDTEIVPYKPTRAKVSDIIDALNTKCPIADEPPTWLDNDEHPEPSDLIAFQNGMLDVSNMKETTELQVATPAFFSYNVLPYDFNPSLDSKIWRKFLNEIFDGDKGKIRLLAQWFGYNLVPDMTQEKMMLFTGIPRSGKSTTLDTMASMLGANQYCFTSLSSLCGRFGFQPMMGKYAALIGDARTPRRQQMASAMEKILQITGGDAVSIDRKGIQALAAVHLKTRFTFTMNDLPAFTDHAKALEARMLILEFDESFAGREDRTLKLRLKHEAKEGKLINFALDGLQDLRQQGRFITPPSSERLLESFMELVSPVQRFLDDCCVNDLDKGYVSSEDLYEAWQCWCDENGHRPGKKCQFGRWVQGTRPGIRKLRKREGLDRFYGYSGISLQPWVLTRYLGKP